MAHLLILELPGGNDLDILAAALNRGDQFSFLTADLSLYQKQAEVAALLNQAQAILELPGFDYDLVEQAVLELHARQPIHALLCLIDIRLIEAAQLCQALGLPHIQPATARLLRDKFSVRQRLAERGIVQADFALAESTAELKAAVARLGLPLLIKPADGYGSQNIVLLQDEVDLDPWLNPLEEMLPCRADYGLGVRANDRLLVERHLRGQIIGCDTLSVNGQHRLLGINEKLFFEPPSFAIRGGSFKPRALAEGSAEFAQIEAYVFTILDALGFDCGATHTELILSAEGPCLIEVNARLVGAKIPRLIGFALGRSVHQDLIAVHLGAWPRPPAADLAPPLFAVTRWIVAPKAGRLARIVLPANRPAGLRCVDLLKRPGDQVRPPLENADRLGYVMVTSESQALAEAAAEAFVADTQVFLDD